MLYEKENFYLNESSFKNINDKYLLFANREDIISFKGLIQYSFPIQSTSYLLTYDMLNQSSLIEFQYAEIK